ncbi:hypothetical protein F2Q70_00042300 [Brassica cretica]|uniref:Uncharacterized protein n=1 Tax=Brassica cretica TaxID=69181 RepID=A0A8S9KLY5_BRACR|nr:hypothetical protein F2Q70_00042300 [Brassica cretica]
MDNVGWEFVLDPSKKGNVFFVEGDIKYEDFLRMVCEDYKISEMEAVYLAYMLPKRRHDVNRNQECVVRENAAADFGSFGNVQYETMKPSQETMNQ